MKIKDILKQAKEVNATICEGFCKEVQKDVWGVHPSLLPVGTDELTKAVNNSVNEHYQRTILKAPTENVLPYDEAIINIFGSVEAYRNLKGIGGTNED